MWPLGGSIQNGHGRKEFHDFDGLLRVVEGVLEEDYYELDDDVVLVPFHSFFAQNPGTEDDGVFHSLIWLDFFRVGNCTCEALTHTVYHMHTDTYRSSSVG
jgi:hypothetical protein